MSAERYAAMTTNKRLVAAGLLEQFDAAFRRRDREEMIRLLAYVELADQDADITNNLLANPARYGC
jgi:hypothetical protein